MENLLVYLIDFNSFISFVWSEIILLFFINPISAVFISVLVFGIHYHMDWFKMKYNKLKGWTATTHNEFWILLGVDQLVHSLTYVLIVYLAIGVV